MDNWEYISCLSLNVVVKNEKYWVWIKVSERKLMLWFCLFFINKCFVGLKIIFNEFENICEEWRNKGEFLVFFRLECFLREKYIVK